MAWRSVNADYHRHEVETYEATNALRLVDISFQKDKTYDEVSESRDSDSLILFGGCSYRPQDVAGGDGDNHRCPASGRQAHVGVRGAGVPVENVPEWKAGNLGSLLEPDGEHRGTRHKDSAPMTRPAAAQRPRTPPRPPKSRSASLPLFQALLLLGLAADTTANMTVEEVGRGRQAHGSVAQGTHQ